MAYIPETNSVVSFQSDPTKLLTHSSVSGVVGSSILGAPPANLFVGGALVTTANAVPIQPPASGTLPVAVPGSVIVVVQGSVATTITPSANQSVSGTVGASMIGQVTVVSSLVGGIFPISGSVSAVVTNFPTTQNVSGSVIAQIASSVLVAGTVTVNDGVVSGSVAAFLPGNASVITVVQGSVAVSITPVANQSVSGTVGASVLGNLPVFGLQALNVAATANPVQVGGKNVDGSVATIRMTRDGDQIVHQHASVFTVIDNNSNSQALPVAATIEGDLEILVTPVYPFVFDGTTWDRMRGNATNGLQTYGSVSGSVDIAGSVASHIKSGSVIAVLGGNTSVLAVQSGTRITSVSGNVTVVSSLVGGIFPVSGSVAAVVTNNVTVVSSIAGGIFPISGSVSAVITNTNLNVSGSVVAFQGGAWTPSVSGDVRIIGSVITVGGSAGTQYLEGAVQSSVTGNAIIFRYSDSSSVLNTVSPTKPLPVTGNASVTGTMSVLGTVPVTQSTTPWTVVSSITGGIFPVSGSVAATITNTSLNVNGSVVAQISSSVLTVTSGTITANQGTGFGSIAAHIKSGSVVAVLGGNTSVISINYAQRNDTIASALGADLTTRMVMADSAGRTVIKPFTSEDNTIISYVGSVVSTSVTLIQASVIGKKNYITDFWLSNTGAATTLVNFKDGGAATIGQFISPTGGGMSSPGIAIPLKTAVSQDLTFQAVTATSVLYLTLKGYQAQ